LIGNVLGNRYRILRDIGAGGMAKVYLAEDIMENNLVAVKVLYPQFSEDISFIQRFTREAKLASTLTDPHIVRVLDWGSDRDLHYLVMEYIEGKDLNQLLKDKGPFVWKDGLELIDQLATALENAHAHGVVHRDIKPQNMMLQDNGLLKVLDFGIARVPTLPSLTQSGFIGSPYYASPEQAMGEEVDIRSDIYSAGIALYELLSGNIPFDAKSPWSIISQHITSEPPPINLEGMEIPQNAQDLLDRMLAKRPEHRFQTPTALRQAIAEVLAGNPLPLDPQDTASLDSSNKASLIDSLYQRATEAMDAQEWARAADLFSQVARLDPTNAGVAQKLVQAERQARLVSLYKAGCRAVEKAMWEEAVNHFNVVIELDPNYEDTNILLAKAHQALKQENSQQFISTRYNEGQAHFEAKRWASAVEAFTEVEQLNPNYQQVQKLLAEAYRYDNPTLFQQITFSLQRVNNQNSWRWGLVVVGLIATVFLIFAFGSNNRASGDDDLKERLKVLYEEAQIALERGNQQEALAKLEQILIEDPDYADAAAIRRELIATPTPTANIVIITDTPPENPLAGILRDAQEQVELTLWTEAIESLNQIRATDSDFESLRVASLFCDAYVGRGLENIANIEANEDETEIIQLALADFEAGVAECPRRTDLKEQAERAAAYLDALKIPSSNYDALIPILTPLVAAEPNYANKKAKNMLYDAYLARAADRQKSPTTIAVALGDYEAALALNVDNPGEAQARRAELLLSFSKQPVVEPTATPEATAISSNSTPRATPTSNATPGNTPTPRPTPSVRIKYKKPQLISPADDTHFAGKLTNVILAWEPVGELANGEYYDLTIMHIFADAPNYSGSMSTRETQVKVESAAIGVGEAGNDRFYWWVTVRKDGTAPSPDQLDLPLSPRSEAGTFIWVP
jgi:serine/threonine protein kinase